MRTKAAILAKSREPLVIDEISLPEALDAGQVLVKVLYTSICGAQINEIDAIKGPDKFLPHLLGHEASGIVQDIGPGVQHVKPGDHVVLHWRPSQGIQAKPASYRWRDQQLNAGWVTTFQEYTVASENRLTVIPSDFDMKIAPLFGCAVTTALGVVTNDAKIKIGDSVLIFGAGGVGVHIVQFARMAGAYPIVVVEPNQDRQKISVLLGADKAMDPEGTHWLGEFDHVIETTGKECVSRDAFSHSFPGGHFIGVGVPEPIPWSPGKDYVHRHRYPKLLDSWAKVDGRWVTQSHGGQSKPHIDIPKLIRLIEAGRLSLDGMFHIRSSSVQGGHRRNVFRLKDINLAIEDMRESGGRYLLDLT